MPNPDHARLAAERPRLVRTNNQLREVLHVLCNFVWTGKLRAGEHLWSIPADNERDFDLILSDAIVELEELRSGRDSQQAQIDALVKERDKLKQTLNASDNYAAFLRLKEENQRLREALTEARNRLSPLCSAVPSESKAPVEKAGYANAGDQIADLSRLLVLHANEAKRFALIGKDVDEIACAALAPSEEGE